MTTANAIVVLCAAIAAVAMTARTAALWRRPDLREPGVALQIAAGVTSTMGAMLYASGWMAGWFDDAIGIAGVNVPAREVALLLANTFGNAVTMRWGRGHPPKAIMWNFLVAASLSVVSVWLFVRYHGQGERFNIGLARQSDLVTVYYAVFYAYQVYGGAALIALGRRTVGLIGDRAASVARGLRALMAAAALVVAFGALHLVALGIIYLGGTSGVQLLLDVSDFLYMPVSLGYVLSTSYPTLAAAWSRRRRYA